ncbi:MAG: hypothetical protein K2L74_02575, partial [Muribaculaceae bacterium]|nr:hypothetical protein [Muribaculaceae bacterium]
PDLGKVVLYQLSYFRMVLRRRFRFCDAKVQPFFELPKLFEEKFATNYRQLMPRGCYCVGKQSFV